MDARKSQRRFPTFRTGNFNFGKSRVRKPSKIDDFLRSATEADPNKRMRLKNRLHLAIFKT